MTEVNRHRGAEHQRALTGLVRILPRGQPPVRCGRASEERTMPRIDAVKTGGGSTYCHQCGSEIGYVNFCPHCGTQKAEHYSEEHDAKAAKVWLNHDPPYVLPECKGQCNSRLLLPEWKYCPTCGTEVPPITPDLSPRCPKCKYRYDTEKGERFCPNDGTPMPEPPSTEKPKRRWWSSS
jgi:hypothetical protein